LLLHCIPPARGLTCGADATCFRPQQYFLPKSLQGKNSANIFGVYSQPIAIWKFILSSGFGQTFSVVSKCMNTSFFKPSSKNFILPCNNSSHLATYLLNNHIAKAGSGKRI